MSIPFARTALSCAMIGCSWTALAQNAPVTLNDTVVSASGFEQKITEAPASISVISREDLQQKRYNNLAQALGDVEGIDIGQGTGKTGGLNISIRGMPSQYTLILIDGPSERGGQCHAQRLQRNVHQLHAATVCHRTHRSHPRPDVDALWF